MSELNKIHHINVKFNRIFSPLIYLASVCVVILMVILPYTGRLTLALLINVFFNRPLIYLNLLSRKIAYPLQRINVFLIYGILFGAFALLYRMFFRSNVSGFIKTGSNDNTDRLSSKFQS